jgi:outer membrane protein
MILALVATSFSAVKAQKVASVDIATILTMMPDKKKADEQLKSIKDAKSGELEKQAMAFQTLVKKYQDEAPKQSAQANEQRSAELQKKQKDIQDFQMTLEKDLNQKSIELYTPIEAKIKLAIDKVAKTSAIDFIFDANNPALLYKGGNDVTSDVRKELGL